MMTLILIISFVLIAFVGLLRYDVHKHKYAQPKKDDAKSPPDSPDTDQETRSSKDK